MERWILYVRLVQAALMPILSDCDEVFNYWEPMHYLHFGYAMQTWEYAPENALRSWLYLLVHAPLGYLFRSANKLWIFYGTRVLLSLICAWVEIRFCRAIAQGLSPRISNYAAVFLLLSPGMYISSAAFLPSTFAMITSMLAYTYIIQNIKIHSSSQFTWKDAWWTVFQVPVFWFAVGGIVGWPFSAAIGIPFVLQEIITSSSLIQVRTKLIGLFVACWVGLVLVLGPELWIDTQFYRKWTLVPWNIVSYNIFSSHGPDLYGTEPFSFYILNGLLNFNLAFVLALGSLPILLLTQRFAFQHIVTNTNVSFLALSNGYPYRLLFFRVLPMYFWFGIFARQPHKEERFLFVMYPFIALNAAIALSFMRTWVQSFCWWMVSSSSSHAASEDRSQILKKSRKLPAWFSGAGLIVFGCLSVSRTLALFHHYSGSIRLYHDISALTPRSVSPSATATYNVETLCVGDEWYRFPSHYFLPAHLRLGYIEQNFGGQLPKYFMEGEYLPGTYTHVLGFNTLNKKERDRYVPIDTCDYYVTYHSSVQNPETDDVVGGVGWNGKRKWEEIKCYPFLDADQTLSRKRSLWVPFDGHGKAWGSYCLYRNAQK